MKVVDARFLVSAAGPGDGLGYPAEGPPEVAFVGRSNVGKSTLLGALMQRKGLVRTSNAPGRTRLINFFDVVLLDGERPRPVRLVDLPGFGYAKAPRAEREKFRAIVQHYLERRTALKVSALLVDLRRGVEVDETELKGFLEGPDRRVVVVATKSDKLPKHERKPAAQKLQQAIGAPVVMVSAETGDGLEQLWKRLLVAVTPSAE